MVDGGGTLKESAGSLLARFVRFGIVGGSGVLVNLGIYALLTRFLDLGQTLTGLYACYAFSVEISIITNFLLNDFWTFADRRGKAGFWTRALRFHLVSLVGAGVNWGVFASLVWFLEKGSLVLFGTLTIGPWTGNVDDMISACIGIIAAMTWNFFANLIWTWQK